MTNTKTLVSTAVSSLMLLGIAGTTVPANAADMEKCYGVVKAGKNDCQTANSSCAGTSTKDGQKDAWLFVPKGTCEKLVGGSTKAGA
jgi:uncharacterized membrane protein